MSDVARRRVDAHGSRPHRHRGALGIQQDGREGERGALRAGGRWRSRSQPLASGSILHPAERRWQDFRGSAGHLQHEAWRASLATPGVQVQHGLHLGGLPVHEAALPLRGGPFTGRPLTGKALYPLQGEASSWREAPSSTPVACAGSFQVQFTELLAATDMTPPEMAGVVGFRV